MFAFIFQLGLSGVTNKTALHTNFITNYSFWMFMDNNITNSVRPKLFCQNFYVKYFKFSLKFLKAILPISFVPLYLKLVLYKPIVYTN